MDMSDLFFFSAWGRGKGESEVPRGGLVLLKMPGGGGGLGAEGPGGVSAGNFFWGGGKSVKWVPFVKLAFSPGNRAHFGSKMGLFSAFSHYVFNDCGPNRGFYSDFDLSPILTL